MQGTCQTVPSAGSRASLVPPAQGQGVGDLEWEELSSAAHPQCQAVGVLRLACSGGMLGRCCGDVGGCRAAQPGRWHISTELGSLSGSGWVTSRGPGSAAPQRGFYSAQSSPESPEQRPELDRPAAPPDRSLAARSPGVPALGAALFPTTRFLWRVRRGPCLLRRHLSSCC